jgi:hypothetical protein
MSQTGSLAPNLHQGSRSEYLAQFVFSSFGTSIPVPHQEDTGIDLYCTMVERDGQRAWPTAYYSVQVKSNLNPWIFEGPNSVKWIIEHPLPIFLSIVLKDDARLLVYHTTPRFAAWSLPNQPDRLELIPGLERHGETVAWENGNTFKLDAPILNFTISELLQPEFQQQAANVLKYWIDQDGRNLFRIQCGVHQFRAPADYKTNEIEYSAWTQQGGLFRVESLDRAETHLKELLSAVASHYFRQDDYVSSAIYAMALRQLSPMPHSGPFDPHNPFILADLRKRMGFAEGAYVHKPTDYLLELVKAELVKYGMTDTKAWKELAEKEPQYPPKGKAV